VCVQLTLTRAQGPEASKSHGSKQKRTKQDGGQPHARARKPQQLRAAGGQTRADAAK